MDRPSIKATERELLGKKVKKLRQDGQLPAHVFGKKVKTEHISVDTKNFLTVYKAIGETGLVDLKIGAEKVRPVLIREVQYHPVTSQPLHIDFYQVNLAEKVTVSVPIELIGEEPEKVHLGEAIVLQTLSEVEIEALPTDLIEKLEANISSLKEIEDSINLGQLSYDHSKITVLTELDEVVVKLAPAVSAEMEQLLEEVEAEAAAATEETPKGAEEEKVEGEEGTAEGGEVLSKEGIEGENKETEKPPQ